MKQFSRPAAGQKCPGEKDVRSPECLVKCVRYLVTVMQAEVARADMQDVYDFVFDRLRAVRQDMVLQAGVSSQDQLFILGVCVRQGHSKRISKLYLAQQGYNVFIAADFSTIPSHS